MFDFGIESVDAHGTAAFPCGCTAHTFSGDVVIGYLLVGCPCNHFGAMVDEKKRREHVATHKRRRKGCKHCAA